VSYKKGRYIATTDSGELLLLKPDNKYEIIGKYAETSTYISTPHSEGIVCIAPNLTKAHDTLAGCQSLGPNKWDAVGEWREILRPYMCGNYLIEATGSWSDFKVKQLVVRDIQTGEKVNQKYLHSLETAGCVDGKVLYIDDKINIAELPTLKTIKTSSCGSPKPISATLIDWKIICLNKSGQLCIENRSNFQYLQ
jgi:hypothetical protein